jgi:hypothetical protein
LETQFFPIRQILWNEVEPEKYWMDKGEMTKMLYCIVSKLIPVITVLR